MILEDIIGGEPYTEASIATEIDSTGGTSTTNPNGFDLRSEELQGYAVQTTDIDASYRQSVTGIQDVGSGWAAGELFKYMYRNTHTLLFDTVTFEVGGYMAIYANSIKFLNAPTLTVNSSGTRLSPARGSAGGSVGSAGTGGAGQFVDTNMTSYWDWLPRGGAGANGVAGTGTSGRAGGTSPASALGYSTSGAGGGSGGDSFARPGGAGGAGGGLMLLIAEEIAGIATLNIKGENGFAGNQQYYPSCGGSGGGGGGGILIIVTGSYDGNLTINVAAGAGINTPGSGTSGGGQIGSYAILRRNLNGTLTLMVHSQNGVSADLNGQTPVHGADASIAW